MTVDGGQVMDKKKAEDVYKLMESRKGEQFAQELLPVILFEGERSGEMSQEETRTLFACLYKGSRDYDDVRTEYFLETTPKVPYFMFGDEKIIFVSYQNEPDVNPYITAYSWNEGEIFDQYGYLEYWDDITCRPWNLPDPKEGEAYIPLYNVGSLYRNVFREYFVESELRKVQIERGEGMLVRLKDNYRDMIVSFETLGKLARADIDFVLLLDAVNKPAKSRQRAGAR